MNDIVQSLNRAMVRQGWIGGDKFHRIGHPFVWVDGERHYFDSLSDSQSLIPYISMFYEQYPTPDEILTCDYEQIKAHCEKQMRQFCKHFFPVLPLSAYNLETNIVSNALVRTQDYCFIKTYCNDLEGKIKHLDIGSGLGNHSIYSLKAWDNSEFYALEASPKSYAVQRHFLRFMSPSPGAYLDLIECENFEMDLQSMSVELNEKNNYRIKHCPSWFFPLIQEQSINLVTATWVLNEVSFSGILWLMSHASRVLRQGGYFYIRDSGKLKPNRHSINYDDLLKKIGFQEIGRLNVRNRIEYFGIPRVYQKNTDSIYLFDELVESFLGKFAVTAHGGDYIQNWESLPD